MTSMIDDIIEEAKEIYSRMSLIELLAEENMMIAFLHNKSNDNVRKKLHEVLGIEIQRKLH
jgi:hypothetical protein